MRIADLTTGAAKLQHAAESLQLAWHDTHAAWRDEAADHIEQHHLGRMLPTVKIALDAINRMADVLARAERDCDG